MTDAERNKRFKAERAAILGARTQMQRDLQGEVLRMLALADRRITNILGTGATEFQAFLLPQLQQSVRQTMIDWGDGAAARLNSTMTQAGQLGIELIDRPLRAGGVRIEGLIPSVNLDQLNAMRTFATDRIKGVGVSAANRINSELGLVVIGAQAPGDAIATIAIHLQKGGRGRALTITRTELGRAFSVAAQERFSQAAEILPGLQKEWRKSGKIHDRPHHSAINGQRVAVDEPFTLGNGVKIRFPRDPRASAGETVNCGCESLPAMASWDVINQARAA